MQLARRPAATGRAPVWRSGRGCRRRPVAAREGRSAATEVPTCSARLEVAIAHARLAPRQRVQQLVSARRGLWIVVQLVEDLARPAVDALRLSLAKLASSVARDLPRQVPAVRADERSHLIAARRQPDLRGRRRAKLDAQRDGVDESAVEIEDQRSRAADLCQAAQRRFRSATKPTTTAMTTAATTSARMRSLVVPPLVAAGSPDGSGVGAAEAIADACSGATVKA